MSVIDDALRGFTEFMDGGPSLPITLAIFLFTAPVLGLAHELGHALAALVLLPGRVLVQVGGPRPLLTGEAGRLTIAVHPLVLPWRFDAVCAYEDAPASRLETVVIALAGPAASFIVGMVSLSVYAQLEPGLLHTVVGLIALASFFSVVVCLVPMTLTDSRGMRLRTDGATVVAALR